VKALSVYDVETQISAVLVEIEKKGEQFIIYRDGEPIADLVPHHRKSRLTPHPVISKIHINYDPTEPLNEDEWLEEA
jgi:antitoxin (DNA-binding transcriptional repressor) of toxin-antitoxin stability system